MHEEEEAALKHTVGKTPLRGMPLFVDPTMTAKRKPLPEGSVRFELQTRRDGNQRDDRIAASPSQEHERMEAKRAEREKFEIKYSYYLKSDIAASFKRLGHAVDLSKAAVRMGDGPCPPTAYVEQNIDPTTGKRQAAAVKERTPEELREVETVFGRPTVSEASRLKGWRMRPSGLR